MRCAAVDIGTNTALLTVAERRDDGTLAPVVEEAEITRLGQGVDRTGRLDVAAVDRTLAVLERYGAKIRQAGAHRVAAVGTQALREVSNGSDFLARAKDALGCAVQVIDGEREARLSWRAARSSFAAKQQGRRTVIDIGGGSTEILVGDAGAAEPERAVSIRIGAVRMTERCLPSDPPKGEERAALVAAVDAALAETPRPEGELIGIAGTVTTLCAMHLRLTTYEPTRVHGFTLAAADLEALVDELGRLPVAARKERPGLDPRRADVIYAGGVILARIVRRAGADRLTVSDRGIRWGLLEELAAS